MSPNPFPNYDTESVSNMEAAKGVESFKQDQGANFDEETAQNESDFDLQKSHDALGIDARVRNKRKKRLCLVGLLVTLVVAAIIAGVSTAAIKRNRSANSSSMNSGGASNEPEQEMSLYEMCIITADEEYAARNNATCSNEPTDEQYEEGIYSYGKEASVPGTDGTKWTQLAETIRGEAGGDLAGGAIAMSCDGSVIAVGAHTNDAGDEAATGNIGHVRVFRLTEASSDSRSVWRQIGQDIDGAAANDRFGAAVSMSADGKRVAIGAMNNDINGESSGHVQVYDYEELYVGKEEIGNWVKVGNDIEGQEESEYFGRSVSLSADGTRLAVGASGTDSPTEPGLEDVGRISVFQFNGEDWEMFGQELYGLGSADYFGRSVALSGDGDSLVVGGYRHDTGGNDESEGIEEDIGHVQVYRYNSNTTRWTLSGQDIYGKKAGDWFGLSVAVSYNGKRIVVGAPGHNNRFLPGYSAVYEQSGPDETWSQIGDDLEGGYSVSISFDGTKVTSGSYKGYGNGINAGQAKAYKLLGRKGDRPEWTQIGQEIRGEARSMLGSSVCMSSNGMRIASGAPATFGEDGTVSVGAVRVFDWCM